MTRSRAVGVLIALLMVSAGFADWDVIHQGNRISNDEQQTCVIQARGLPAGHELAASMKDIHALLTFPPSPGSRPVPRPVRTVVNDLNQHLAKYLRDESKQPQTRACK